MELADFKNYKPICEIDHCHKYAKGEYQRMGDECVDWDNKMPIALCKEHAAKHIPVICRMLIICGKLIIRMRAYPGFKLRRNYFNKKGQLKALISNSNVSYATAKRRVRLGLTTKEIVKETNYKKQIQMMGKDLQLIKMFASAAEASRELGIKDQMISKVLSGKKKSTRGYIFKYAS